VATPEPRPGPTQRTGSGICTPAAPASRRNRRVAPWRSIRAPWVLSKTGPQVRLPIAWPMALPTAAESVSPGFG